MFEDLAINKNFQNTKDQKSSELLEHVEVVVEEASLALALPQVLRTMVERCSTPETSTDF
jgi:hypothetical protein